MNKLIEFDNGLRAIVKTDNNIKSVCCCIMVGAGSIDETEINNGLAHFTEHMMFKGTLKYTPFDIADGFEKYGINVNAFTTKECTCYYFRSIFEYFENGFKLLCDIFCNSTFPSEEIDKEKKVIVEEINMTEDDAEDIGYDLLARCQYDNHPLGRAIIGLKQNVLRFEKKDILKLMNDLYTAKNIVIAFAGNINVDTVKNLILKYLNKNINKNKVTKTISTLPQYKNKFLSRKKDFEQSLLAFLFPSINFDSKEYALQSIATIILGGGMSSRLFQQIREKKGLAYSIYSLPSYYNDSGAFNIVANINPKNTESTYNLILEELNEFKKGITVNEFERAKTQLKTSFIFGMENMQNCILSSAKLLLMRNKIFNSEEKIKQIEDANIGDVNDFINKIINLNNYSVVYVGKDINFKPNI